MTDESVIDSFKFDGFVIKVGLSLRAKRSNLITNRINLDCFVAALLAMISVDFLRFYQMLIIVFSIIGLLQLKVETGLLHYFNKDNYRRASGLAIGD